MRAALTLSLALPLACVAATLGCGSRGRAPAVAPFGSSGPSFGAAKNYITGGRLASSVAIGDLNGDSKPDLVTANTGGTVSVLLNRGDGTFRAKHDSPTGRIAWSVAIGDLNGDGKGDLATGNRNQRGRGTVSVLLHTGHGAFEIRRDYTAPAVYTVAIGDLNGDGSPDLATANAEEGSVSVLLNNGDGRFQSRRDFTTGPLDSVAIGDLNGDGKPDLATDGAVLLNRGDGSFRARRNYRARVGSSSVAIGDLNGDGKPDLVTANYYEGQSVSVLLNKDDGRFEAARNYETFNRDYGPRNPVSVAIGDLNGDGNPDLATANDDGGGVIVLRGRGDGTFHTGSYQTKWNPDTYLSGTSLGSIASGDLNADRKPDLVVTNGKMVSVLLNVTDRCVVPDVGLPTLLVGAKRAIAGANCRVGEVRRTYSTIFAKGTVIDEEPKPDTVLPKGAKVDLVVSRGRRT